MAAEFGQYSYQINTKRNYDVDDADVMDNNNSVSQQPKSPSKPNPQPTINKYKDIDDAYDHPELSSSTGTYNRPTEGDEKKLKNNYDDYNQSTNVKEQKLITKWELSALLHQEEAVDKKERDW